MLGKIGGKMFSKMLDGILGRMLDKMLVIRQNQGFKEVIYNKVIIRVRRVDIKKKKEKKKD